MELMRQKSADWAYKGMILIKALHAIDMYHFSHIPLIWIALASC